MTKRKKTSNKTAMKFVGIQEMPVNANTENISIRPIETFNGKKGFIMRVPTPTKKEPYLTKEVFAPTMTSVNKILKGKQ